MSDNKLKEQMNKEIRVAINKYNAAVFVLNGGSATKALAKFNHNIGGKAIRVFCKRANPDGYRTLMEIDRNKRTHYEGYYDDVHMHELRENKHLFIGDSE
jgi:predicted alpha/beta superfamily hydrolase